MRQLQRIAGFSLMLLLLSLYAGSQQAQEKRGLIVASMGRAALVIGNDTYVASPLRTAVNDARDIAKALERLNFRVTSAFNVDKKSLTKAIDDFAAGMSDGDWAVVYFAGHGIQIDGQNYLAPIDFDPKDMTDAEFDSYPASRLIQKVQKKNPKINTLFLDACRKNSFRTSKPETQGLAPMEGGPGSYIVFAAAPGKTVPDTISGRHSLFAGFLLDALKKPNLTLGQVFSHVRDKVYVASNQEQLPVNSSSATADVRFRELKVASETPAEQELSYEEDLKQWNSVKDASGPELFQDYLKKYPRGNFTDEASLRINSFLKSTPLAAPVNTVTRKGPARVPHLPETELKAPWEFNDVDMKLLEEAGLFEKRLDKDGLVFHDDALNIYLDQVGKSILPTSDPMPNILWRFRALRDPIPNAFALPNGSIYINSGLLALLDNEGQLASVLAHEITHVTARHGYRGYRDYRKKQLTINIIRGIGSYAPGGSNWGASLQLASLIAPNILIYSINGYKKELERQADLFAISKLFDTGYDPREMVNTFRHLDGKMEVQLQKLYYSDHPVLEDRINYVTSYIESNASEAIGLTTVHAEQYQVAVEKVARANVQLSIEASRHRTAIALAKMLVDRNPRSSENVFILAEAYRKLGPRSPEIQSEELTHDAMKKTLKMKQKMTPEEEEVALMSTPNGPILLQKNLKMAEGSYLQSLELDSANAKVHRSLGMLYEKSRDNNKAAKAFQKYLDVSPDAPDRESILRRLRALEKSN